MTATAAQIVRVRRMAADSSYTYTNTEIGEYIEMYPCLDERGEEPYTWETSTEPPTQEDNDSWIPTYDLAAAAADIWAEKAGAVAGDYNTSDQGESLQRSQVYEHYMASVRYWRARRRPKTARMHKWPDEDSVNPRGWICNLAEPD